MLTERTTMGLEHEQFRDSIARFLSETVASRREEFEHAGMVSRDVWLQAGAVGLLGISLPEEHGGLGLDYRFSAVAIEEQGRLGLSGPGFMMHSGIVAPYIERLGTEAQKERWLPPAIRGEAILSIGMTEPDAGSDLKALRTRAVRDGDAYVLNGSKIFITNGPSTDLCIVACRTGDGSSRGISLLLVDATLPGFRKGAPLKKIGMGTQDTNELFFDDVRVPADCLLGEEGLGFRYMMEELPWERLQTAMWCQAAAEAVLRGTLAYVRERRAFGSTVFDFQNTRFKLAEIATALEISRVFVDRCLEDMCEGRLDPAVAAMAKLNASDLQGRVVDECLQLHGGYGYVWEYDVARAYADARIQRIWGGTNEIMKEIIARRLP